MRFTKIALICALLAFAVASAFSQSITGTISGVVKDPNGAVVPGAKVVARNAGTNAETATVTNEDGLYRFANLTSGQYVIEVEAKGFRRTTLSAQTVSAGDTVREDVTLELGSVTESVTVETTATQVNTEDAQLGKVLRDIPQLPVLSAAGGRNPLSLVGIQPGVNFNGQVGPFSVNGQRAQANNYMLDGGDSNDLAINIPDAVNNISPNALAEFRVITGAMKAEYGRNSGAVVMVTTKSGTNEWHGGLSEIFRNTRLNAVPFFQKSTAGGTPQKFASGLPRKPQWNSNDFDANVGGRIIRDKTFFFASYLGFRRRQGVTNSATVPNDEQRAIIEQNGAPVAKALLALVPRASTGNTLFSSPSNSLDRDQGVLRIDHYLSRSNQFSGSYFIEQQDAADPFAFGGSTIPGFGTMGTLRAQNFILRDTHTFSPALINEFRASFHRRGTLSVIPLNHTSLGSLGLTGIKPDDSAAEGPPYIGISGFSAFGNTVQGPQGRADNTFQYLDNVSWTRGRHLLKFGGEFRTYAQNQIFDFQNNGSFTFDGSGTDSGLVTRRIPGLSSPLNDFANGFATELDQANANRQGYRTRSVNLFAQDDWKARPNLTFNLGLRWEYNGGLKELRDQVATFRKGQQSKIFPDAPIGLVYPGDEGIPRSTYPEDLNNFAPRVGFAWDVFKNGRISVRGGYGIFYDQPITELTLQFLGQVPFGLSLSQFNVKDIRNPYSTSAHPIPQPFPFTPVKPGGRFNFVDIAPIGLTIMDPNFRTPYGQQYDLQVQTQLAKNWVFDVAYVGSTGVKLLSRREMNPGIPGPGATSGNITSRRVFNLTHPQRALYEGEVFDSILDQLSDANSNYNSLQLGFTRRYSNGFSMSHAYTWAHGIDNASGLRSASRIDSLKADRGNSEQDVRQRYVGSYIFEFPWLKQRGGPLRHVLGGWGVSGVTTFQTGTTLEIYDGQDRCLCGSGNSTGTNRPDYIGGKIEFYDPRNTTIVTGRPNSFFNGTGGGTGGAATNPYFRRIGTAASFAAGAGRYGNLGRNLFHGPGINTWDISAFKKFRITERHILDFRAEFFNAFNHTQFRMGTTDSTVRAPSTNINSVNFGRITDARDPRLIQLALRYTF